MKNEAHLKSAYHTGRHSHYFSAIGTLRCHDERPTSAFIVISQRPFFANVTQPILLSSTAFNQCIKIVLSPPYQPREKTVWKKTMFSSIIKDIGADFVFPTSKRLCSDLNVDALRYTCNHFHGRRRQFLQHFITVKMSQLSYESELTCGNCHFSPLCVVIRIFIIHPVYEDVWQAL